MKAISPKRAGQLALLILVCWLAGAPIITVLRGATSVNLQGGFTLDHLHRAFLTDAYVPALLSTLKLGALVGLSTTLIGGILAWIMSRLRPPGESILEEGIMAPIFISPFIGAIGWITLGQPRVGMLNAVLKLVGLPEINIISYGGTVFIMCLFFVPFAYVLLRHSLDRLNPELEEAAAICGASQFGSLSGVVLPLLWPSILSAMIITFILASEMFSIPGLLLVPYGYDFLPYIIYARTTHWPIDQAEASAVGVMLLIVTIGGMLLYSGATRIQERFITVGPRSPRQVLRSGRLDIPRLLGLTIVLVFILLAVILPVASIALRSLLPYFSGTFNMADLTLSNITVTLSDRLAWTSLMNSLIVAVISTTLLLIIAFLVALYRIRDKGLITTLTWIVASVPIAVPGVLIGVGLVWLYIGTPVYATIYIIILVMLARFMPVLVRLFETGFLQLGRELDEAAQVCGASELTITREIRLPLLAGTIRSAAVIGGTQVFNELTASALLFTSASSVLPVVIFNYMFDGDYSRAAVLALVQVTILMTGIIIIKSVGSILKPRSGAT